MSRSAKTERIRVLALALIRDRDRLFLSQGLDPALGAPFWRPLGGGVEFGERSTEALKREFREEISADIEVMAPPALFENLFTFNGRRGHEIILLHEARFADEAMLDAEPFTFAEPGPGGSSHRVQWVALEELRRGEWPLYPDGLLAFVEGR